MADYNKPIPVPDPYVNGPYWAGAKEGKFMLPRCTSCNHAHFYPRLLCPICGARTIVWEEASGEGYLRFSYANSQDQIRKALERVERMARDLRG